MEFPTVADMSLNSCQSNNGERIFTTLDSYYQAASDDEVDDRTQYHRTAATPSPMTSPTRSIDSPTHKRYLYPQKEFVDELRPEELRWFYRVNNTKKWQRFIGKIFQTGFCQKKDTFK